MTAPPRPCYEPGMVDPERLRRYARRPITATFRVRDAADPTQGDVVFDSLDVSQGGAFLQSDLLLEVGEVLEVIFAVPGRIRPIRTRARVAWATRHDPSKGTPGMGLEFLDLSDEDRLAISEFVGAP